eukprot:TRINITY_DN11655_c0_g1_i2.p1 TRINITY_DN11655_c0_g1~~TRINITY_DN11655_c0_g1_i2.p1  ORF type:complete len:125 (+),score=10.15 TRINITY_DN11655_c0_g1_i2:218-592(+)
MGEDDGTPPTTITINGTTLDKIGAYVAALNCDSTTLIAWYHLGVILPTNGNVLVCGRVVSKHQCQANYEALRQATAAAEMPNALTMMNEDAVVSVEPLSETAPLICNPWSYPRPPFFHPSGSGY